MSETKSTNGKLIILSILATLLTLLTAIFGAPIMRLIHLAYGSLKFWLVGIVTALILIFLKAPPMAALFFSVWLTIGFYTEVEQRGLGWKKASLAGVLAGTILLGGGALAYAKIYQEDIVSLARETIQTLIDQWLSSANSASLAIDKEQIVDVLLHQLPSALISVLVISLGLALIYERKIFRWLQLPHEKVATHLKLLDFKVPDFVVWILMVSFLFSFIKTNTVVEILATNTLNVLAVVYFFQGLAVIETTLILIRAGFLVRLLVYLILIGQLFLLVSAIGFFDYWLDLRRRLKNRPTQINP